MRSIIVSLLAAYSTVATLVAGRLDVAIIQFPEEKTPAELESTLAKVNIFDRAVRSLAWYVILAFSSEMPRHV